MDVVLVLVLVLVLVPVPQLLAELDDFAQTHEEHVPGGTQAVTLTLGEGLPIAGSGRDRDDKPVPAYTLLVTQRQGVVRKVITTRSVIDPKGRFEVRV